MLLCRESFSMKAKPNVQLSVSFQLSALHDSCYQAEGSNCCAMKEDITVMYMKSKAKQ